MNDYDYYNQPSKNWINKDNWWKWLIAAIVFVLSPIYLALRPNDFTPLVQILLSLFLFLMAFWIGFTKETERATRQASDKWLPQAESVIYRLLTLHNNVKRFADTAKNSCNKTKCDLPELEKDEMRAVKIKIQTDCESTSQRLTDIAFQLEDATEDWRRFIAANCTGDECSRIFDAIQERRAQLEQEIADRK
jgi:hypothetical protein